MAVDDRRQRGPGGRGVQPPLRHCRRTPLVLVHGFPTSSIDYFALQTLGNQPDCAVLVDQSAP